MKLLKSGFVWGFADQGLSSATNFGLSLLAGRLLGPAGLGAVAVGFASYLAVLGFQRALLTEPLVAASTTLPPAARREAARSSLTVSIAGSLAAAALVAIAGAALGGRIGHVLVLFAPWLPVVLVQDFQRAVLFRDGRGRAAALNDGTWLAVMVATVPAAVFVSSEWAVVSCWGLGGLASVLLGFTQIRCAPRGPVRSLSSWRAELWPFGRWLGLSSVVYAPFAYGTLFVLAGVLGTARLGGLQSVVTVFAPMSLIGPALALPGLPAMSRALLVSRRHALVLVSRLGAGAAGVTALYVGVLGLGGSWILRALYGRSFSGFAHLIWPVGAGQIVSGAAIGMALLLKAERRGQAVLLSSTAGSGCTFGLSTGLAANFGTSGAAWGLSGGAALGAAATSVLALRGRRR